MSIATLKSALAKARAKKKAVKKNPAKRTLGQKSRATGKKPTKRLMARRAKDTIPGYYPNPEARHKWIVMLIDEQFPDTEKGKNAALEFAQRFADKHSVAVGVMRAAL